MNGSCGQLPGEMAKYEVARKLAEKELEIRKAATDTQKAELRAEQVALAEQFVTCWETTNEGWQDAYARGLWGLSLTHDEANPNREFRMGQQLEAFQRALYGISGHILTRGALLSLDVYMDLVAAPSSDILPSQSLKAQTSKVGSWTNLMGKAAIDAYIDPVSAEVIRQTSSLVRDNPNNLLTQLRKGVFVVTTESGRYVGDIRVTNLATEIWNTYIDSTKATDTRLLIVESKAGIVEDAYVIDMFGKYRSIKSAWKINADRYTSEADNENPEMNGIVDAIFSENGFCVSILKPPKVMDAAELASLALDQWRRTPVENTKEKATYGTMFLLLRDIVRASRTLTDLAIADPKKYVMSRLYCLLDLFGLVAIETMRAKITEDPGPRLSDVDWNKVYILLKWWQCLHEKSPNVLDQSTGLDLAAFEPLGMHDNTTSQTYGWLAALMHDNTLDADVKKTALSMVALGVVDPDMLASDWPYPPYDIAEWRFIGQGTEDWYSIGSENTMTGKGQFGVVTVRQEVDITQNMDVDKIQLYLSDLGDVYNKTVNFNIEVFKDGCEAVGTTRLTQEGMVDVPLDRQVSVKAGDKLTVIIPVQNATGQVWLCNRGTIGSVERGRASGFSIANSLLYD